MAIKSYLIKLRDYYVTLKTSKRKFWYFCGNANFQVKIFSKLARISVFVLIRTCVHMLIYRPLFVVAFGWSGNKFRRSVEFDY